MNTLKIDINAPVDNKLKNRYWSVNIEGTSKKYKINENGELMSYSLVCNKNIENSNDISGEYLQTEWVKMEDYTGVIQAKDKNNEATFIISNGVLQNVKNIV